METKSSSILVIEKSDIIASNTAIVEEGSSTRDGSIVLALKMANDDKFQKAVLAPYNHEEPTEFEAHFDAIDKIITSKYQSEQLFDAGVQSAAMIAIHTVVREQKKS